MKQTLGELYPPKNKDPFHYKRIDGKLYRYRYYNSGKEYTARRARHLIKRGYGIKIEWLGDERYIIWEHLSR